MKYLLTPHNTLLLEATAIMEILNEFNMQRNALEKLYEVADQIIIPDQVFYELTAILPSSVGKLKDDLRQAKSEGGAALDEVIEGYVRASPRRPQGVDIARQLRMLLHFVADHPDTLQETQTGKQFCDSLQADHAMLDDRPDDKTLSHVDDYRPSRGDVMTILGPKFKYDHLRVHIDEIYQIGLLTKIAFLSQKEYDIRMKKDETISARKRRFIGLIDFLNLPEVIAALPPDFIEAMKKEYNKDDPYLQVQQLRRCIDEAAQLQGLSHTDIDKMANIGHMNMGQYLHSGVIPLELATQVAAQMGFKEPPGWQSPVTAFTFLHNQGFFEHSPTVGELKTLLAQHQDDPRFTLLAELVHSPKLHYLHAEAFKKECRNSLPMRAETAEGTENRKLSETGVPYEKTFSEALVAGVLSFADFFSIVRQANAMVPAGGNLFATPRHDMLVEFNKDAPENSIVYVRQNGFMSRSGNTILPYPGQDGVTHEITPGQTEKFWSYRVKDVIALGRQAHNDDIHQRHQHAFDDKMSKEKIDISRPRDVVFPRYHRVFDAMMYGAAHESAPHLHHVAHDVLGETQLLQVEKDFSTLHYRNWRAEQLPAFNSTPATIHSRRRIASKHLGEIAIAECAVNPPVADTTVWIANHDTAIRNEPNGSITLAEEILRQRTEIKAHINDVLQRLHEQSLDKKIESVPTFQLADVIRKLVNMDPQSLHDSRLGKTPNARWENLVNVKSANVRSV